MSEEQAIQRILLIRSGSNLHALAALAELRRRYPEAQVSVLGTRAGSGAFTGQERVGEVITYDGALPDAAARRALAQGRFDLKVVLLTGEGRNLLKMYAFTIPARRMIAFTEGGGSFRWDIDDRLAIWNHLKWRLSGGTPGDTPSITLRRNVLVILLGRLARTLVNAVLSVVALVLLLAWHARFWMERRRG